jgi:replicative DNA helicase
MHIAAHAPEAERTLLGQILIDNSVIDKIGEYVPEKEVFYDKSHQKIWETIQSMRSGGEELIDVITIMSRVQNDESNELSAYYLTGLIEEVVAVANAEQYAKILYEKWLLRKVIKKADIIKNTIDMPLDKAYKLLQSINSEIDNVLNMRVRERFNLNELVDETAEHIKVHDSLVKFGYEKLDSMTGGMTRGEITVIAGRPGHFKSTMMINIVKKLIMNNNKVLVFNREMSNVEMMKKLFVLESKLLNYDNLRSENMANFEIDDLGLSKSSIKKNYQNLLMFDNIFDIEQAMREIRKHRPDVVVDDYIGLIDVFGIDDNRLRVDSIMKQYKRAAKTYNMCVILVSQLNRECESRANKRPILRDLRDSGSIEQDAEMVLFMYYDWRYNYIDSEGGENELEVILGKNRYGRTGSVALGVIGDRCSIFNDVDKALKDYYRVTRGRNKYVS